MAVRAKMRCTGVNTSGAICASTDKENPFGKMITVTLQPVYGGADDKANAEWSKWTPSGELKLAITNPAAYEQFEVGKAYYVDLTPAES